SESVPRAEAEQTGDVASAERDRMPSGESPPPVPGAVTASESEEVSPSAGIGSEARTGDPAHASDAGEPEPTRHNAGPTRPSTVAATYPTPAASESAREPSDESSNGVLESDRQPAERSRAASDAAAAHTAVVTNSSPAPGTVARARPVADAMFAAPTSPAAA